MAITSDSFTEITDNYDPGGMNISLKGGKSRKSYWFVPNSVDDFAAAIRYWVGSAKPAGSTDPRAGAITRTLPIGHPQLPALFAETVSNMSGIGGKDWIRENSASALSGTTNFPKYARYPKYQIDIEFSNRHYDLVSDTDLGAPVSLTWNDEDGSGVNITRKCWNTKEYNRWVWVTGGPKEQILTAKQGKMVLDVNIGGVDTTQQFLDQPKLALPDGAVKITWFEVPYSYVRPSTPVFPVGNGTSFFQLYQGRVNQFQFLKWYPGELLYLTIAPTPYNNPVQDPDTGKVIQLCDIDIICLETKRLIADADNPNPGLANWLAAGWNLQPWWQDMQFHYAHLGALPKGTAVASTEQRPTWRSFPFEILFSDPEVALPV